jgi:hypothetical protein
LTNFIPQAAEVNEIGKWLMGYWAMLLVFRGIEVPEQNKMIFQIELIRAGYTSDQRLSAEKWMKLGDWTYKGKDAKFIYQDFFPTPKQLESIKEGFVLLSKEELVLKIKSEKESAVLLSKTQNLLHPPTADTKQLQENKEYTQKMLNYLDSDIPGLRSKITTLESKVTRLKRENRAYEQCYNIQQSKIHELENQLKMAGKMSVLSKKQVDFIDYLDGRKSVKMEVKL